MSRAQDSKEDIKSKEFFNYVNTYTLNAAPFSKTQLPFNQIKFIDARFDTTSIGYTIIWKDFQNVAIKGGLCKTLQSSFNQQDTQKVFSALCIVQNFHVTSFDTVLVENPDNRPSETMIKKKRRQL